MKELSVSDSISQGWELAKKHGLLLAVFVLVIGIVMSLLNSFVMPSGFMEEYAKVLQGGDPESLQRLALQMSAGSTVISVIQTVIEVFFMAGFCATIMKLVRGIMEKVSLDGFKMPAMTYLKYFAVCIIIGLAVGIGSVLCIIPGIFFAVRLAFADWYILDHPEAGIGEAISASWNMTKGNFWSVFGLLLSEIGIILLGFLCCCIGVYFAIPFALFAESCAYATLHENLVEAAPVVNEYVQDER